MNHTRISGTVDVSAQGGTLPPTFPSSPGASITRVAVSVAASANGRSILVSTPSSGNVRVNRALLTFGSASIVNFVAASAGNVAQLTGAMHFSDKGSLTLDKSDSPWFIVSAGRDFAVNTSAATIIGGFIDWY